MKRFGWTLILISALALAASCARPVPTPTLKPQPPPPTATRLPILRDPVTIVFWHTEPEGTPAYDLLSAMVARFQEENPWITIHLAYVGDYEDIYRKGMAAIRAGNPPDLATAYPAHIAEFMKAGAIVPLQTYAKDPELGLAPEDRDEIYTGFWQAGLFPEFGNQMLSLPYARGALALYYNLTALKAAKLEGPPTTWEDFEKDCRAAARGDVTGYAYVESAATFDGWLYSRGASQLTGDLTRATYNGAEGVAGLELLLRLLDTKLALRPMGEHGDRALFVAGKAVFAFDSTAALPAYAAAIASLPKPFEWGCTLIPQAKADEALTVLTGADICVFKTSEARQQAAWRFLRWFSEPQQAAEWASTLGYGPLSSAAVKVLASSGWLDKNPQAREAYETVLPHALPEPNVRGELEVQRAIEGAWLAVAGGAKGPQQALDEAAAKADEALAARR